MNKLINTLKNTGGRFTTLIINRCDGQHEYCAKINKVSEKFVKFEDINSGRMCHAHPNKIVFVRSGKLQYRKPRRN